MAKMPRWWSMDHQRHANLPSWRTQPARARAQRCATPSTMLSRRRRRLRWSPKKSPVAPAPSATAAAGGSAPECRGRGWVTRPDAGTGSARRCACAAKAIVPRLEQEAGVPSRYARCTLANFQSTGRYREQLLAPRSLTQRWVEEVLSEAGGVRGSGLLFIGPPGVGKTHLAAAALGELIRRYRVRGRFVDFTSLLYQIQSTFDSGAGETKRSVLDPACSP